MSVCECPENVKAILLVVHVEGHTYRKQACIEHSEEVYR